MAVKVKTKKELFADWLFANLTDESASKYLIYITDVEEFAIEKQLISGSIFDVTDASVTAKIVNEINKDLMSCLRSENRNSDLLGLSKILHRTEIAQYFHEYTKDRQNSSDSKEVQHDNVVAQIENTTEQFLRPNKKKENEKIIDLFDTHSVAYGIPTKVVIQDNEFIVSTWTEVYVCIVKYMYKHYSGIILMKGASQRIFKDNNQNMRRPVQIYDECYIETNVGADRIISKIKFLLELCEVEYKNLSIYYRTSNSDCCNQHDNLEAMICSENLTSDHICIDKTIEKQDLSSNIEGCSDDDGVEQNFVNCSERKIVFSDRCSVAHSKPTRISIQDHEFRVSSWADAYELIFKYIYHYYSECIPMHESFVKNGQKIDCGSKQDSFSMRRPRQITSDCYIETNLSAKGIIKRIKALLSFCNIEQGELSIYYKFGRAEQIALERESLIFNNESEENKIDFDKASYMKVLMSSRYQNGMRLDSIDLENFRDAYKSIIGDDITVDDSILKKCLIECGIMYRDRFFPAEGIIDSQTKEKLFNFINESFSNGKKYLYYKSIFTDLQEDFAYCFNLTDEYMLKAYLMHELRDSQYFFNNDYMTNTNTLEINYTEEIEKFFLQAGKPLSYDDVYSGLSHISSNVIYKEIKSDQNLILNEKKHYYHIGIFELSSSDIERISDIIESYISDDGYCIWPKAFKRIKEEMPLFIEHNAYLSSIGIRNALAQKIGSKFNFDGQVICAKNQTISMSQVYSLFGAHYAPFSDEDLYNFSKEVNDGVIYFNALASTCVRISKNQFIPKDQIFFDVKEIDKALSTYVAKEYVVFREIDSFLVFPNVGYEWNQFLLESYLLNYSQDFVLLNNGTSLNNIAGAVVKSDSCFNNFAEICSDFLAKSEINLNNNEALDYLVNQGLLTRRKYGDIEMVLEEARRARNNKG